MRCSRLLITAPSLIAFKQGIRMTEARYLRPGWSATGEFPIPLFDVVANCIKIRGSFVGTRQDMAEVLAFAAEGKVKADIELHPLSSINKILDRLEHGEVASRVVLEFKIFPGEPSTAISSFHKFGDSLRRGFPESAAFVRA